MGRSYFLLLFVLDILCCAWAVSSCGEWGLLSSGGVQLLVVVASLVVEHRL